jgi:hypothetical protein
VSLFEQLAQCRRPVPEGTDRTKRQHKLWRKAGKSRKRNNIRFGIFQDDLCCVHFCSPAMEENLSLQE